MCRSKRACMVCHKQEYKHRSCWNNLWTHETCPILFTLAVDEVKYIGKEHVLHMIKLVHLSMPGYIVKALQWFGHEHPRWLQILPILMLHQQREKAQYIEIEQPLIHYLIVGFSLLFWRNHQKVWVMRVIAHLTLDAVNLRTTLPCIFH